MTLPKSLTTVTPFSKSLAVLVFILLPFVGFFLGVRYQQIQDLYSQQLTQAQAVMASKPTSTPDQTVIWKVFRFSDKTGFGYQLKLPNNWSSTQSIFERPPATLGPIELAQTFYENYYGDENCYKIRVTHFEQNNQQSNISGNISTIQIKNKEGVNIEKINNKSIKRYSAHIASSRGFYQIDGFEECLAVRLGTIFDSMLSTFKFL